MTDPGGPTAVDVASAARLAGQALDEVNRAIVGKRAALELVLCGVLAGGHVLIEDLPGLGKTLAARSFAQALGLRFTRAQFTPDLLPADLTGSFVFDQRSHEFVFRRGPLFTGLLLADEINRTPPKTQSALLEAMRERQITVEGEFDRGQLPPHLDPGLLVVMLSPLVSHRSLDPAVVLARRGMNVMVIDCLPPDAAEADGAHDRASTVDPYVPLAWRMRLLERDREVRRVVEAGIAVVPWRGPGSLDLVLRDLQRQAGGRAGARRCTTTPRHGRSRPQRRSHCCTARPRRHPSPRPARRGRWPCVAGGHDGRCCSSPLVRWPGWSWRWRTARVPSAVPCSWLSPSSSSPSAGCGCATAPTWVHLPRGERVRVV